MSVLGSAKRYVFTKISKERDSYAVRQLHKAAKFIDSAVNNEGSHFRLNGEWRVLERLASANFSTVIDAGANVGRWSMSAMQAWPSARVHAFEIAPETSAKAKQNFVKSGYGDRAVLHHLGLSDQAGEMEMWYFPGNDELTCSSPRHFEHESVSFTGKVITLDEFCKTELISKIDFLKIDVEGNEYKVMHGGSDIIQNGTSVIQFEYGAFSVESRFLLKDYYSLLSDRFWIGKIFPNKVDFTDYHWTMDNFRFSNYICVDRNRSDIKEMLS